MATNKRTKAQRENDAKILAELLIKNTPIREMTLVINTQRLGMYQLSFQQVHYDIKKIIDQWRAEREEFVTERIYLELAKIDKIESECWNEWERSKTSRQKTVISGGKLDNGHITKGKIKTRESQVTFGDVRYLEMIDKCIDKRIKLLGLYAPIKVDTGNSRNSMNESTRADIEDEIRQEMAKLKLDDE